MRHRECHDFDTNRLNPGISLNGKSWRNRYIKNTPKSNVLNANRQKSGSIGTSHATIYKAADNNV